MPDAPAKVCVLCNQDCSARPRVKDKLGRYVCKSCEESRKPSPPAHVFAVPAAPPDTQPAQPQNPDQNPDAHPDAHPDAYADPHADQDPDTYDLAPDGLSALLGDGPKLCPSCGQPIPAGSVLCLGCGYDERQGRQLSTGTGIDDPDQPKLSGKPAVSKCPKCGYDLKGLKKPRCPECGTIIVPKSKRQIMEEEGRRSARMEYIRPLIMLGAGLAGTALVYLGQGQTQLFLFSLLSYAVTVPAGVAAFFFLCLIWFGFNAPMHLTALRLAGIFAITDLVEAVTGLTGLPIIIWPATFFTYYGLIMKELDIDDWKEAFAFSFLMKLISGVAVATLVSIIMSK